METADPSREREDDDDYDLLTYGEAGARLTQEVARHRARLADLERRTDAGERGLADDVSAVRSRLELLIEAAERNSRRQINDENFEQFFGFPSRAR